MCPRVAFKSEEYFYDYEQLCNTGSLISKLFKWSDKEFLPIFTTTHQILKIHHFYNLKNRQRFLWTRQLWQLQNRPTRHLNLYELKLNTTILLWHGSNSNCIIFQHLLVYICSKFSRTHTWCFIAYTGILPGMWLSEILLILLFEIVLTYILKIPHTCISTISES